MKPIILLTIISSLSVSSLVNAQVANDDASNYTAPSWANGSNQGTGFNAWDLSDNNNDGTTVFASYFIGDSTAGTGDLNTSGQSFGMYANPGSAYATAIRGFSSPLNVGEVFSIDLGVNYRNGNKGLDINDSGLGSLFNFNVGSDDYQVNGNTLGLTYQADSIFTLSFEQKAGTNVGVKVQRQSNAFGTEIPFSQDIDLGAPMDNFKLYVSGTDGGGSENNLYANNLSIIPEPNIAALFLSGLGLLYLIRRKAAR